MLALRREALYTRIPLIAVTVAVTAAAFARVFFGVETTDEAYYISAMRLISKGLVPFTEYWTQSPGWPLFFSWVVGLYEKLTGGLEGIFLFCRVAFTIFKLLLLGLCYLLLRKRVDARSRGCWALFLIALIPFAPFNLSSFSYNTIPFFFVLLTGILLLSVYQKGNEAGCGGKRGLL
ncbi:MAG: hypothetical protein LBR44_02930, partial [Clostridiales Family XIII bacterium]|nr:hypothetical protein [Clostridiales Family XIII bacterium]